MRHTIDELRIRQALPLDVKIRMTQQRVREWLDEYGSDGVYVSFSGGKDSTVLLHLVRQICPDVTAVFVDTGLEYPEIREFVKGFDNVVWLKPKMQFRKVIETYGYPFISKEVSEAVEGARRYLHELTHRQTDRQTDRVTFLTDSSTIKFADLASMQNPSRGGADNRYRKCRGIGEYSRYENAEQRRGQQSAAGKDVRVADEGQSSDGEYP